MAVPSNETWAALEARRRIAGGGSVEVLAQGGCMSPTIPNLATVRVEPAAAVRVGRVYLIEAFGATVMHRVVAVIGRGPRARIVHVGDNATTPGIAGPHQIIGRVLVEGRRTRDLRLGHLYAAVLRLGAALRAVGLGLPERVRRDSVRLAKGLIFHSPLRRWWGGSPRR